MTNTKSGRFVWMYSINVPNLWLLRRMLAEMAWMTLPEYDGCLTGK